ncbi:MAG: hypothetical protein K0B81_07070 [Candidatus Cloacimonetes bacterium]|nr:hypothetical protein [Candidatus Cloacimonadota bacterium]
MQDKCKTYWERMATKLAICWSEEILQIATYNSEISDRGNLIVVLKDDSIKNIVKAHSVVKELTKMGMEPPLVVSEDYIANSLDSFPLEFLNIKTDYQNVIVKKEVLEGLQFEKSYIRLEMERELKSKILLIKMAILDNYGKPKVMRNLIKVSVHSIEPILKGLLFLLDVPIPLNHKELIDKADEVTDFPIDSLLTAVDFTLGRTAIKKEDFTGFFDTFTKQLQVLSDFIEQLKIKG